MKRAILAVSGAAVTVLATLTLTVGTASATDWEDTDYDVDQADASGILEEYFDEVPDGSSRGTATYLSCPDAPGPGVSEWKCERVPVGTVVGQAGGK